LPGPDECHDVAVAWVKTELGDRPNLARLDGRVRARLEEAILAEATRCLTTPYDRETVDCVLGGASPRACLSAIRTRKSRFPPGETP